MSKLSTEAKYLWVLAAAQALFLLYSLWYFLTVGRLPSPFFYNAADSYMDFYNTNYWAYNSARFEEWKSIYPLFVFVFSQLITSIECISAADPFALRSCDSSSIYYLVGMAVLASAVSAHAVMYSKAYKQRFNPPSFAMLVFVFLSSFPLLNSLERGNYLILALLFLALSLVTPIWWISALFLAAAINIKQYLLVLLLAPFLKRQWSYLSLAILACIGINILSLILISEPKYELLFQNMFGFSESLNGAYFEKIWNPTSLVAWDKLIRLSWHVEQSISSNQLNIFKSLIFLLLIVVRLVSLAVFIFILLQSERLSQKYISAALLVFLMVNTDALGGYSLILLFPFLGAFSDRPLAKWLYLLTFGMLLPVEIPIGPGILNESQSWLSGLEVHEVMFVTFGALIRPCILMAMMSTIGIDILIGSKIDRNFSLEV